MKWVINDAVKVVDIPLIEFSSNPQLTTLGLLSSTPGSFFSQVYFTVTNFIQAASQRTYIPQIPFNIYDWARKCNSTTLVLVEHR